MYFLLGQKRKRGRKRGLGLILSLFLCVWLTPLSVQGAEEPSLYATAAVLMDADTGRVLFEKNGEEFMANASTTKIMTCIVALENADLEGIVEVSSYAAGMPKVKLYMRTGEHFKLQDLLYSLMLESHNDSAVAIAEHVGGSMEGFAAMMNEKAREIGCENTWFITPNGLDAAQTLTDDAGNALQLSHGTCAVDLARMMAYCTFESEKAEEFLQITRTLSHSFFSEEGRSFTCTNHNAFLHMMDGALSGKTGFTNKAGYCYVGALEKDGKRFTIALLACGWPNNKTYKWSDSKALFRYGLENYTYHDISEVAYEEKELLPVYVENGQTDRIGETAYVNVGIVKGGMDTGLLLSAEEKIAVSCQVKKELPAPVKEGSVIGSVRYFVGELCLREDAVVTLDAIPAIDFWWCLQKVIEQFVL